MGFSLPGYPADQHTPNKFRTTVQKIKGTPSVLNYKAFQEFWRIKASQVLLNLYDKIITFMM